MDERSVVDECGSSRSLIMCVWRRRLSMWSFVAKLIAI